MRVVHVITRLILGGAQENTLITCKLLAERGHDVTLITGPALVSQVRVAAPAQRVHSIFSLPSSVARPVPAAVQGLRRELLRSGEEFLITYVGSFAAYQGLDLLFAAIPLVVRRCPAVR